MKKKRITVFLFLAFLAIVFLRIHLRNPVMEIPGPMETRFKMAVETVEGAVVRGQDPFTFGIAFTTGHRTGDHWTVTVEAPDFTVDCPEQVWAEGEPSVPNWGGTDYEHLPHKFEVTLTPKPQEGIYSGTVSVTLAHPEQTGTVTLYYYGDKDICCFSKKSIAAEGIHYLNTR